MSLIHLKVDALIGSDISDVIAECQELADRIGVVVECPANGVTVWCRPGDDPQSTVEAYHAELQRPGRYALAVGRPRA